VIYACTTKRSTGAIDRLRTSMQGALDATLRTLPYEDLFAARRAPVGHYLFLDLDRLSRHQLDTLAICAGKLAAVVPAARLLNRPHRFLDRAPLLARLHALGINDFAVAHLGLGERPRRYPVFIRATDGHHGAETDLIDSETDFERVLAWFAGQGIPTSSRIAIGYRGEAGSDGLFRKYGVINIGGRLIPQHVMFGRHWMVKNAGNEVTEASVAEELAFVRRNPHRRALAKVFRIAGVEFGRIDYGIVEGRVQVYEINTNPFFPRFEKPDERRRRRMLIREQVLEAFRAIDRPLDADGDVTFEPPSFALSVPSVATLPVARNVGGERISARRRVGRALAGSLRQWASALERVDRNAEQAEIERAVKQAEAEQRLQRKHRKKRDKQQLRRRKSKPRPHRHEKTEGGGN